ncbi:MULTISPECIES: YggS family pyridoxal phosphate-dependent enzyme [Cyanophyceae]|uniref:Pyridoxal phosphate homeostasis protein n=1 Tax=Leptolyngbya subtilissima DQ-A4 TaxID=2933933 RepID=A0ABV0K4T9_9CYAN|nr:YggS family pyridoxal phosphate-dependent enzyme [Nodosilinea sp. FACHB-141]MBD2112735.1 YggS family pyridoxal phosphate-dependent enzyme [Nodosilinea sp. FACHB-141]
MTAAPGALPEQFDRIQQSIPPTVTLIAVTKFLPVETIRSAYDRGIRHFGESRVQEAIAKQADLSDLPDITWHLIGRLQTNKARKAVEHFDWIHSVDSLNLAQRLDQAAQELEKVPQCCLQVKLVPDPPKAGLDAAELPGLLPQFDQLAHLKVRGLMTIPPQGSSEATAREVFARAKSLADTINQTSFNRLHIDQLSMGMSGDYEAAIACGATMVRLGTILFGSRPPSPQIS